MNGRKGRRVQHAARIALAVLLAIGGCGGSARGVELAGRRSDPIHLALPALDGGTVELARLRGRVVVLHLFSTWALSAQDDQVELEAARKAHPEVAIVGIAFDPEGAELVEPWRQASGVAWPIALATREVRDGLSSLGAVPVVPATLVLDRRGRAAWRSNGPLRLGQVRQVVRELEREAGGP